MTHAFRITITRVNGETVVITEFEADAFKILEQFMPNMDYKTIVIDLLEKKEAST